jgi:hypothetical protein
MSKRNVEEYQMTSIRTSVLAIIGVAFLATVLSAQDFSKYREFQFGASLPVVAKQVRMKPAEAKTTHRRPAMIQELEWQALYLDSKQPPDSVRNILFSFYNNELFRLVVTYDREHTAGLLAEDIIEALSAKYGIAAKPVAELILSSTYFPNEGERIITERSEKVIARWEDEQYSYNLIQPYLTAQFGLVIYAKRLDALARAAIVEAVRLDKQEAPQRESERQKNKDAADRAKQAEARRANKGPFRP